VSALDAGQIEQVIGKNILLKPADIHGTNSVSLKELLDSSVPATLLEMPRTANHLIGEELIVEIPY
jgi:hypothetical protein